MGSSLTTEEVREALEDRISRGIYPHGGHLPPVRSIAAELGTSPSTISRAVQLLVQCGYLEIRERRYVRVARVPSRMQGTVEAERAIKALATRWKLKGGRKEDLCALFAEHVDRAYRDEVGFMLVECNRDDLDVMGQQIAEDLPDMPVAKSLIRDLHTAKLLQDRCVLLVPYYHFAEVKQIVGAAVPIIPVHSSPDTETLDALVAIEPDARVLVVGHNQRSVARLSTLVTDYAGLRPEGITIDEVERLETRASQADLIVAVKAAEPMLRALPALPRTILLRFRLESSLRERVMLARHAAHPIAAPSRADDPHRHDAWPSSRRLHKGGRRAVPPAAEPAAYGCCAPTRAP